MADTMGQASAMTGGYGSSYAQSVGQQAYQNSLDSLNDIVPELYQMAYDRYNQEGADMLNQLGVLDADHNREFDDWEAGYNVAKDKYSTANSAYYSAADLHNTDRANENDLLQADYTNRFDAWNVDNQNAWKQVEFEEDQRQFAASHALDERRVKVAEDELALKKNSVVVDKTPSPEGNKPNNNNNNPDTTQPEAKPTVTYDSIEADLNTFIKYGASKSEINGYLRAALNEGHITQDQYNTLKEIYAPRGYTYSTGTSGRTKDTTRSFK
jgi:hypothetical protein